MHRTREPDAGGGGLAEAGTGETWCRGTVAASPRKGARDVCGWSRRAWYVRAVETEVAHGRGLRSGPGCPDYGAGRGRAGGALDTRSGAPRPPMHGPLTPLAPRDACLPVLRAAVALLVVAPFRSFVVHTRSVARWCVALQSWQNRGGVLLSALSGFVAFQQTPGPEINQLLRTTGPFF
jgi:hypothetical protein